MVDTRIPQNIIDTIIKRFEAIENGDLVAFNDTFKGHDIQDGAGIYQQMSFIIKYFGTVIGVDQNSDWINDNELYKETVYKIYGTEHIPQKRNMWASIEIIDISDMFGIGAGGEIMYLSWLFRNNPCCLNID